MAEKRPIDRQRDSGKSMVIGADDDNSAITDMIPIDRTMYLVKERGLYTVRLADEIDPQRTNPKIPDTQQRVLSIGSSDPMVTRTLLTADTLFDQKVLRPPFERDAAMKLVLQVLKDLVALTEIRAELEQDEAKARTECEAQQLSQGSLRLPAIRNLNARCDAFAQKSGHIVNALEQLAKLFYGDALKSKWIDSLTALAKDRYGADAPFALFMDQVRPFLLFVRDMRNMIEHPTPTKFIAIQDFRLHSSGKIALPSVEIVRPGEAIEAATITLLMNRVTDELVSVTEMLIAFFSTLHVQPFSGMPVEVVELPPEQRGGRKDQRFFYGVWMGGQLARFG